jgi:dipeptidyl-peptidase-4
MSRALRLAVAFVGIVSAVSAQTPLRTLTIDAIYDPERRVDFNGSPPTNLRWIDDDSYLQSRRSGSVVEWLKVDAASGRTSTLFDQARMEDALASLSGLSREKAAAAARSGDMTFTAAYTGALVTIDDELYFYDIAASTAARLTSAPGAEEEATFSPDGRRVAFVRGHNLHVVDVRARNELALTSDGSADILNGKLDWLYQEEIYGRGRFRGYWWSPDSNRLAFLQLDERPVPEYTVVDDLSYRPTVEVTDYPKAGDPNPLVKLGIVDARGGPVRWVSLDAYKTDILIVDVDWMPDGKRVSFQVQDREQRRLDLHLADAVSARATAVLQETTPAWVNVNGSPVWLADGSFLWLSERDGFKHLYRYRTDGTLVGSVTNGRWEIRTLHGVDEKRGLIYFSSGARRHIDTDVYRTRLDGGGIPTRLSRTDGTHRATFSPSYTQYIDVWNDATTPSQVRLYRADGTDVRTIDANLVRSLADYRLSKPEFLEVRTRDGFVMDAMMIKPPDFDPSRRYPVFQLTYAGPGTASVRNAWGGTAYMFHQLLAQHGIIV